MAWHLFDVRCQAITWTNDDSPTIPYDISLKPQWVKKDINHLVQDCGNSSALAMEIQQSCTKPSDIVQDCSNSSVLAMELQQSCTEPSI